MPKSYNIKWLLDDSQAMAAFKRGVKGFDDVEKSATRAAKAMEAMFAKSGQSASAAGAAAQTATEKMTAAAVAGSKKRAKASDDADKHIDIGLHKLQVSGIGYHDKLTAAAKKSLATQIGRAHV